MNKRIDNDPFHGDSDKYIKTKIKLQLHKTNKYFRGRKMRKENTSCIRLSLIMLEFLIKVNKKYYPQTLLDECKYEIKENKIIESY